MPEFPRIMLSLVAACLTAGCVPYAVATTATPVKERSSTLIVQAMPAAGAVDTTLGRPRLGIDSQVRMPMDEKSDLGVRLVSGAGIVANYKRLLTESEAPVQVAVMPGMGILNVGSHAHLEGTLLMSGRPSSFTPYGGIRVMHLVTLRRSFPNDRPTAGGFLGFRIGNDRIAVSPEVGVFYDYSTVGGRGYDIVVVPSLSLHGDELFRGRFGRGRGRRP